MAPDWCIAPLMRALDLLCAVLWKAECRPIHDIGEHQRKVHGCDLDDDRIAEIIEREQTVPYMCLSCA